MTHRRITHPAGIAALLVLALLALALPGTALASNHGGTGTLRVQLIDGSSGAPAGNIVCLEGGRLASEICGGFSEDAIVRFVNLPEGDYRVNVANPGSSGKAQVRVRSGEVTDVRLATVDNFEPGVVAYLSAITRLTPDGFLADPVMPVRVLISNRSQTPAEGVELRTTGPAGAPIVDCYVSGPGDDPCVPIQDGREAAWNVGTIGGGQDRGPYIANFRLAGPPAGIPGFAWVKGGQEGQAFARASSLGFTQSLDARGSAGVRVQGILGGQVRPGTVVTLYGPASEVAITGPDGQATFPNVPPGRYFLAVDDLPGGEGARARTEVTVPANRVADVRTALMLLPNSGSLFAGGPQTVGFGAPHAITTATAVRLLTPDGTPASPSTEISVSVTSAPVYTPDQMNFTTVDITGLRVAVTGPAGMRFAACTPGPCGQNAPRPDGAFAIPWTLGALDPFATSPTVRSSWTVPGTNPGPVLVSVSWTENGQVQAYELNLALGAGTGW